MEREPKSINRLVLNDAKIALVFLSKANNDTYTRRAFEIAAAKTVMLSKYTNDMASLYKSGEEIFFFKDEGQCLTFIARLLSGPELMETTVNQAYSRLTNDGHEIYNRASELLKEFKNLRAKNKGKVFLTKVH
jgi:spore maturation protein CgeB